jgi:hypothetical protein
MRFEKVNTLFTIKEMTTEGHAPVLFHCDNGENYFCKYRTQINKDEINCLAYEFVCTALLIHLDLPTPEVAFVKILPETLDKKIIVKNKRMREGMTVFGSKEITPVKIVDELSKIDGKSEFAKIANPLDIIKIAIFDLWTNNSDRGKDLSPDPGFNYNLLLSVFQGKEHIIAFDHAFAFGGVNPVGNLFPDSPLVNSNRLHLTPYYRSILENINENDFLDIVDNFIPLLRYDYEPIISETFAQFPREWELLDNLELKIVNFLSAENRIRQIEEIIKKSKS